MTAKGNLAVIARHRLEWLEKMAAQNAHLITEHNRKHEQTLQLLTAAQAMDAEREWRYAHPWANLWRRLTGNPEYGEVGKP